MQLALVITLCAILLYDNAQPHIIKITLAKLTNLQYETFLYSPYFLDLLLTDNHFYKHQYISFAKKHFVQKEL